MNTPSSTERTALITGGGRGAGAAIARALTRAGMAVVLASRTRGELEATADALRQAGGRAWAFECDVSIAGSIDALTKHIAQDVGAIDVLVNNAGVSMAAPVTKTSLEDWQHLMSVNATGAFLCTRAFLPNMLAKGWGRIINIASTAGLSGDRYIAAYAASKHAVIGLTRATAAETAEGGVTVNAICPTFLDTEMTQQTLDRIVAATGRDRAAALASIVAKSPQKRLVTPEEVAAAVVFLCGEQARGITGSAMVIDGGELRR